MRADKSIQTKRLLLKPLSPGDGDAFYELAQDQGFNRFPITVYTQKSREDARRWVEEAVRAYAGSGHGYFGIWQGAQLLGLMALRPTQTPEENRVEITYRLRESAWGRGYALEASVGLMKYGFGELALGEIAASITPDNEVSKKIAAKLGMRLTGKELMKGVQAEIYRVTRAEFDRVQSLKT